MLCRSYLDGSLAKCSFAAPRHSRTVTALQVDGTLSQAVPAAVREESAAAADAAHVDGAAPATAAGRVHAIAAPEVRTPEPVTHALALTGPHGAGTQHDHSCVQP